MLTLTFHPTSRRVVAPSKPASTLERLSAACGFAVREWHVRRSVRALEAMDPHMLLDLGVSPGGIEDAVRHGREA